jgi:hypothetical protein
MHKKDGEIICLIYYLEITVYFPNKADADRDELINIQCTSNLALNLLVEMDKNYFNYSKYLKSTIFYALD